MVSETHTLPLGSQRKPDVVLYTYDPRTRDPEAGRLRFLIHPELDREFLSKTNHKQGGGKNQF